MNYSTTHFTPGHSRTAASELQVHIVTTADQKRFEALLAQHHPLGPTQAVGDFLCQVVIRNGQSVALLVWGPAALKLNDRDRGRHAVAGLATLATG